MGQSYQSTGIVGTKAFFLKKRSLFYKYQSKSSFYKSYIISILVYASSAQAGFEYEIFYQ